MAYFQTKNPNLGKFLEGLAMEYVVYFWPCDLFCGHVINFVAIWCTLWSLGIFFLVLVCCTRKNLATLVGPGSKIWVNFGNFWEKSGNPGRTWQ
jgi:hypothetical protein